VIDHYEIDVNFKSLTNCECVLVLAENVTIANIHYILAKYLYTMLYLCTVLMS